MTLQGREPRGLVDAGLPNPVCPQRVSVTLGLVSLCVELGLPAALGEKVCDETGTDLDDDLC